MATFVLREVRQHYGAHRGQRGGSQWLATTDTGLQATGAAPNDAIESVKRMSLEAMALDVDYLVSWTEVPRRDVVERDLRITGKKIKWTIGGLGQPFSRMKAQTFAWLLEQRFVLPSQHLAVGHTAAAVVAYLKMQPRATLSGELVGPGRPDCRVEVHTISEAGRSAALPPERAASVGGELQRKLKIREAKNGWRYQVIGGKAGIAQDLVSARDAAAAKL